MKHAKKLVGLLASEQVAVRSGLEKAVNVTETLYKAAVRASCKGKASTFKTWKRAVRAQLGKLGKREADVLKTLLSRVRGMLGIEAGPSGAGKRKVTFPPYKGKKDDAKAQLVYLQKGLAALCKAAGVDDSTVRLVTK